jgi:hypothetical protein
MRGIPSELIVLNKVIKPTNLNPRSLKDKTRLLEIKPPFLLRILVARPQASHPRQDTLSTRVCEV